MITQIECFVKKVVSKLCAKVNAIVKKPKKSKQLESKHEIVKKYYRTPDGHVLLFLESYINGQRVTTCSSPAYIHGVVAAYQAVLVTDKKWLKLRGFE